MKKKFITTGLIIIATIGAFIVYFYFNPHCFGLGCTGGYSFQDTATYIAPKSKLEIIISAAGFVPEGADYGNGKSFVKMYSTDMKTDTMILITSPENIDTITYKGKTIPFSCRQIEKSKLYDYMISVGYKQIDLNEITELRDAITLINYGHKTGFYAGQTKHIIVGNHKRHTTHD